MNNQQNGVSPYTVNVSRHSLKQMLHIVHGLQRLSESPHYSASLSLPHIAQTKPQHFSVLMGYDFHIDTSGQVKLIEVNTNAGGLWFATQNSQHKPPQFPPKVADQLLSSFLQEYHLFCQDKNARPRTIAIIDQTPTEQFLYPEMQIFANLFEQANIKTIIIDPNDIEIQDGILFFHNQKIDLIYNRHCDFYLNTPEMQPIAQAWQQQSVCLTPNPRIYGLLADKRRMIDWSDAQYLPQFLPATLADRLHQAIPETHLLHALPKEQVWSQRKQSVFKPTTSYASRGVYIGNKLTKKKFDSLDPEKTLVQQWIKPSLTLSLDKESFKTDYRLFVYRHSIINVTARLYQGQVTNLRTPQGGFSKIKITRNNHSH